MTVNDFMSATPVVAVRNHAVHVDPARGLAPRPTAAWACMLVNLLAFSPTAAFLPPIHNSGTPLPAPDLILVLLMDGARDPPVSLIKISATAAMLVAAADMITAATTGFNEKRTGPTFCIGPTNAQAAADQLAAAGRHVATTRADDVTVKVSEASTVEGAANAAVPAAPKDASAQNASATGTVAGAANKLTTAAPKIADSNMVASVCMVVPSANTVASSVAKVAVDSTVAAIRTAEPCLVPLL